MPYYVNVPVVAGVPPVLDLPAMAVASVSDGLASAADSVASITDTIANAPATIVGDVAGTVSDMSASLGAAAFTVAAYPSAVMNEIAGSVGNAVNGAANIAASIASAPLALVGTIAGAVENVGAFIGDAAANLANMTQSLGAAITGLTGDTFFSTFGGGPPQWGIFDQSGSPIIQADNTVSLEYKQDWVIADYPLEEGAFQSYDKVQLPFDVRVAFTAGGSLANRAAFLDSIAAVAGDLNLYDVVMPEATYVSVNIAHYDYKRTSTNGLGLMMVNVWCQEVRVTATTTFSNTQRPGGANSANGGTVQPVAATSSQESTIPGIG